MKTTSLFESFSFMVGRAVYVASGDLRYLTQDNAVYAPPSMTPLSPAALVAIFAAGVFFLVGLLAGVWKYLQIRASAEARAHVYVDTAHRAALLYAFAALLLGVFATLSAFPSWVNIAATAAPLAFFAFAITNYIIHGALQDTNNTFKQPHRLGKGTVAKSTVTTVMIALVIGEIGGFVVLFIGFLLGQFA